MNIRKHSVLISGHATSISVEDAFWRGLVTIAERRGISLNRLVADIDRRRDSNNLSSALRVFVLNNLHIHNMHESDH